MTPTLFSPLDIGALHLSHRVVMAPLTRMRASSPGNVPTTLNVEYYRQRTTAGGLIIAEGSQISQKGQGMPATPGIYSAAQIEGWRAVTDAVHEKSGLIVLQLWHVGRISHSSHQPNGGLPVAPSAIAAAGNAFTANSERVPFEQPQALEATEIPALIESYAQAARNAKAAGFDGVEIHGANGYLLEQFLQSRSNHRDDNYGGSVENRSRLVLEVAAAVSAEFGADHVGIRLSPYGVANDSGEDDPLPLYTYLISELAKLDLAYLHLIEPRASGAGQAEVDHKNVPSASELFRPVWPNVLIAAGNYRGDSAETLIAKGHADAVAFGRLFIANPDLPERLRRNLDLNAYDRGTFYGGGQEGYTDYPAVAS
ncbi:alkene reductase [Neorhizobium sp. JUb45]|uniref:alkene reductase n=1 Tax=Neorhizobium sp. JUb45 TaxID=2485113 RepID=UPI00104DE55F|nr:alkene reductase [Neorhizobium sp. JUb45]TCQ99054.1 N-ethylmaleimide reductase [Neorhizobium sp. JUb45]